MIEARAKESILIYGPSGSGKTTQTQELAKFVHKESGKQTRLVSISGGGWSSIQPAVDAGIVIPTYIGGRKFAAETIHKMSQGYWPVDPTDPESPLVEPKKQSNWKDVGALSFDGITEGAEWVMGYLVSEEAHGRIKSTTQGLAAKFKDGDTFFGTPAQSHYGTVQGLFQQAVANSKRLQDLYVLWSALELKATDEEGTKLPLYGPDICGKKKTSIAPAWFENTLHLHISRGTRDGVGTRRMYLVNHYEGDTIPYIAKNRGHFYAPLPDYLEGNDLSLGVFITLLRKSHEVAKAKLIEELK